MTQDAGEVASPGTASRPIGRMGRLVSLTSIVA